MGVPLATLASMRPTLLRLYVAAICGCGVLAVALLDWSTLPRLLQSDWQGLVVLLAFGLLGEWLAVAYAVDGRGGSQSISFIPILASVILFGQPGPVLVMLGTGGLAELAIRKKERIRAVFNAGQYALSAAVAAIAFAAAGGQSLLLEEEPSAFSIGVLPFLAFAVVLVVSNNLTVSLAITISGERRWRDIWSRFVPGLVYDLVISPLSLVTAFLYVRAGLAGLLVSLLPLLFIRHAYLNSYRLQQSNQDLLKALVKAIETRDPYTSGHSQRVAALAASIARALHLPPRKVEEIEGAALLHDVGKIDAIYTDILKKAESLSPEEREIIEGHVAKGVELLRSLASVPDSVILAVRHHHERFDGRGYPDGIAGERIPIAARIIMVCDAIDAMLSDRPYRRALSLKVVREQLRTCSGSQFDPRIAEIASVPGLLENHVELLRRETQLLTAEEAIPAGKIRPRGQRASSTANIQQSH